MPISVNWPSVSKEDGLNQNSFVDSSYVNIPAKNDFEQLQLLFDKNDK